ncbi:MAG: zinc ribbon domain-containing protein [Methanoregula sp.]|nr:zinc ribbon domain-containing protein [Methanoregula sp.]
MDNQSSHTGGQRTCTVCGSQVVPGHKFCESCGAKMEELPACRNCGARFIVPVKFCESCGTPVTPQEKPRVVITESPVPEPDTESEPDDEEEYFSEPEPTPPQEKPRGVITESPEPDPDPELDDEAEFFIEPEPAPPVRQFIIKNAPAPSSPIPDVPYDIPGKDPAKKPDPAPGPVKVPAKAPMNKVQIIGGIIILLVVIAGIFFVGLPLINKSSAGSVPYQAPVTPADLPTEAPEVIQTLMPTTVITPVPTTPINSLVPLPTVQPPKNQEVFFQVQKNQVNTGITVLFEGGPGSNSISSAEVRVTHPDGTVVTGIIQPSKGIREVTLGGSKETDRVEVIVKMYTGQTYRVIDELHLYKER